MNIDTSYDRNINPPALGNSSRATVTVSITILSILAIDEIKSEESIILISVNKHMYEGSVKFQAVQTY